MNILEEIKKHRPADLYATDTTGGGRPLSICGRCRVAVFEPGKQPTCSCRRMCLLCNKPQTKKTVHPGLCWQHAELLDAARVATAQLVPFDPQAGPCWRGEGFFAEVDDLMSTWLDGEPPFPVHVFLCATEKPFLDFENVVESLNSQIPDNEDPETSGCITNGEYHFEKIRLAIDAFNEEQRHSIWWESHDRVMTITREDFDAWRLGRSEP